MPSANYSGDGGCDGSQSLSTSPGPAYRNQDQKSRVGWGRRRKPDRGGTRSWGGVSEDRDSRSGDRRGPAGSRIAMNPLSRVGTDPWGQVRGLTLQTANRVSRGGVRLHCGVKELGSLPVPPHPFLSDSC